MARTHTLYEAKWTAATRKAYYAEHPENFADPKNQAFPIKDRSDVGDAWNLAGHADNPDAVRAKIKAIAKRLKLTDGLPDTAKDGDKQTEGNEEVMSANSESSLAPEPAPMTLASPATISSATPASPRERIATITVCWIEDNVRSLNGRIYPTETVNRLISSAQRKITENDLPVTCFLSHADADNDHTPALIGRVTNVWREGSRGMASIDLADTSHARDALALIVGGYIRTESLRASNAQLRTDPHYDVPIVVGEDIELDGIDLTNYPGLEACARIQQVRLAESANAPTDLTEIFDIPPQAVAIHEVYNSQKGKPMTKHASGAAAQPAQSTPPAPLTEAGGNIASGYTPTSGNTVGMTNDPPQDAYSQAMYKQPPTTSGPMAGASQVAAILEAHDRIAMVQSRECAPAKESARWNAAFASLNESDRADVLLREAGKAISKKNDSHLDAAHDALAKCCEMKCAGVNNKREAYDPDNDGDDDSTNDPQKNPDWALDQLDKQNNMESSKKGNSPMTEEEALKILEARGYGVQRPKTEAEKLQEQLATLQAEQKRVQEEHEQQLKEMKELLTARTTPTRPATTTEQHPQRKSLVNGANTAPNSKSVRDQVYQHGQYLREKIQNADWEQLADRTCPIPSDLNIEHLIKEFEQLYAVQYDDRFQILSATELR